MKIKVNFIKTEDTYTVEFKNKIYNVYVGKDAQDDWWLEIIEEDGHEPNDDDFNNIRNELSKLQIIPK